jgi:protein-L-isoaspartate(D-aspartate) O-methyltransferase
VTLSANFAALRQTMVDSQVRTQDVTDLAIQDAMRAFPRESLTPPGKSWLAYADAEIEYAPGRRMLRPRDVAKLLQAVRPRRGEGALAIAAPYAAAILELMDLNVSRLDDGDLTAVEGTFQLIICEGAVGATPQAWKDALAVGGRLAVIERDGPVGRAMLYMRSPQSLGSRALFDCTTPVMAGFEAHHSFAL